MKFSRNNLISALEALEKNWADVCGTTIGEAVCGPFEPRDIFLSRTFDLEWTDELYAELEIGTLEKNKKFLIVEGCDDFVNGIYDARVRTVEGSKETTYYFYEI